MAKTNTADTTEALEAARQKELAAATAEVQSRVDENDKAHRDAERKGAAEKPHVQEASEAGVIHSDRQAADGATVAVDHTGFDPEHPNDVGQEELGMGPFKIAKGNRKGAPIQPASRSTGAHTKPANAKEDGTPLVFDQGGAGGGRPATGIGAQAAKTSGGSVLVTGGPGLGGTVMSDLPAAGLAALPTFSDRVITDSDMGGPVGVIASGAPTGKRLEAPHDVKSDKRMEGVVMVDSGATSGPAKIESDRLLKPGEEGDSIPTPQALNRERPHSGGGEALGMGPTTYLNVGKPALEGSGTTNEVKAVRKARSQSPKANAKASVESGQESAGPKTKVQRVSGTPQAESQSAAEMKESTGLEIETKDVKDNPSTEQKDKPVETGTKAPEAADEKSE